MRKGMPLYLDACAFAKRYLDEGVSTERMREITGRFNDWGGFVVSSFVEPEVISALAKHARTASSGILRARFVRAYSEVVTAFRKDLGTGPVSVVPLSEALVAEAARLLEAHPEYTIGSGDAVHLATAKSLRPTLRTSLIFVTADSGLEKAAKAEGLTTMNPMNEGLERLERFLQPQR
jgi:predicted nucleic acid-binding protein